MKNDFSGMLAQSEVYLAIRSVDKRLSDCFSNPVAIPSY